MNLNKISRIFLAMALVSNDILATADDYKLLILHNNDLHARFEETEPNSVTCLEKHRGTKCLGGFARTAHLIRDFRAKAAAGTSPPVLYLNAGDTFVGTAWFSVFTWNISSNFMNKFKPDAVSLGNHEFDLTPDTLARFVKAVNFPVLAANLDFSKEPTLEPIKKSVVLDVAGRKVGVIGYLTPDTLRISAVGAVTFVDEISAIAKEAQRLDDQGIKIIIAVGHSGYEVDKAIARNVKLVDVVVGGHSNTFLWNGAQPSLEAVIDPYPKVVTQASGKKVPVVQAYAYSKYLGVLKCTFNANGDLTHYAGQPILIDTKIPQDQDVVDLLEIYRPAIKKLTVEVIGKSKVELDGARTSCRYQECNFGNLITDALVSYTTSFSTETWTRAPIALYNAGGIRSTITLAPVTGEISRGDLLRVLPYENQVVILTIKGSYLKLTFEQMVRANDDTHLGEFPQVSGIKLVVNLTNPVNSRVVSVEVRCGLCLIPVYEPLDPEKIYTITTSSFLSDGGDGVTVLRDYAISKRVEDLSDNAALVRYIQMYSPLYPEIQGRITVFPDKKKTKGDARKLVVNWLVIISGFVVSF